MLYLLDSCIYTRGRTTYVDFFPFYNANGHGSELNILKVSVVVEAAVVVVVAAAVAALAVVDNDVVVVDDDVAVVDDVVAVVVATAKSVAKLSFCCC